MSFGIKGVQTTAEEMFKLLRRVGADKNEHGHYIFRGEIWVMMGDYVSAITPVIIPTSTRVFKGGLALPLARLIQKKERCEILESE